MPETDTLGKRICSRWLIGLACSLAASVAHAEDATRASLAVWAIGLPNGYVVMEHQAPSIRITADDAARGEVTVRAGSRIAIVARNPESYSFDFHVKGALARKVRVDGLGQAVELGATDATSIQLEAAAGRRAVEVDYRFVLAPDAKPGTYPWPVEIAIRRTFSSDPQLAAGARRPGS